MQGIAIAAVCKLKPSAIPTFPIMPPPHLFNPSPCGGMGTGQKDDHDDEDDDDHHDDDADVEYDDERDDSKMMKMMMDFAIFAFLHFCLVCIASAPLILQFSSA